MRRTPLPALLAALLLPACTTERPTTDPLPVGGDCNVVTEVCALPFPSSRLTRPEPASPTGFVVHLSDEANYADHWASLADRPPNGFSPSTMIATWMALGSDPAALPPSYLASLDPDSTVQLVVAQATSERYAERVPIAAELVPSSETGANMLVVTPLERLQPGSRYAVVVTDGLLNLSGTTPRPNDAMASLLANTRPSGELAELWDYYRDLVHLVDVELGIDRDRVIQLWDFHTATEESLSGDLDAIVAGTEDWLATEQPALRVAPPRAFEGQTRFDIHFDVPLWHADRDAAVNRDPGGLPVPVGTLEVDGAIVLPNSASPENPALPMIFGHALSASANQGASFMAEVDLDSGPFAAAAIDWDLHGARGSGLPAIIALAGRLNTPAFAAAMLQSTSDSLVLAHHLKGLTELPERGAVVRQGPLLYLGQSLGSLVGGIAATVNEDLDAIVLNVGGGTFSQILRDGEVIDIVGMRDEIEGRILADPPEDLPFDIAYNLALIVSQLGLDSGDPATFAPRLADGDGPPVLVQWSQGDGVVPNRATEVFARTAGLPLVTPSVRGVAGLSVAAAPTCGSPGGGLSQFVVSDNSFNAHLALGEEEVQEQVFTYFASFLDDDPDNDGNIAYGLPGEGACPAP